MKETFQCPRRVEHPRPWTHPEDDHWRDNNTCSYCGSLNPEQFLQLVREGAIVGPTDKSYKVYLSAAPTDEEWEQDQQLPHDRRGLNWANHVGKFYTVHLSPEQGDEFRRLYVTRQMRIGYPGNFYQMLYVPSSEPRD